MTSIRLMSASARAARSLPLRGVNERTCRSLEPSHDSHGELHPDGEPGGPDAGQLIPGAPKLSGKRRPRQPAFASTRIEGLIQRGEIPSQATVRSGRRQRRVARMGRDDREKAFRSAPKPTQDEKRMLAGAVAAPGDTSQRGRTDRVIVALPVENGGLVPDLIRNLPPTEPPLDPLRIDGLVQRDAIKVIPPLSLDSHRSHRFVGLLADDRAKRPRAGTTSSRGTCDARSITSPPAVPPSD